MAATLLMQYWATDVISPHITKQKQWTRATSSLWPTSISAPQIIVVRADLPVKTLPELIAYAKANPGKLNYALSGNGSLRARHGYARWSSRRHQDGARAFRAPGPALHGTCWAAVVI